MQYAIETFSLTKIFSDWWGRSKVYAVEDLDLKIRTNEVFGLLGPNGSGKTTTLKMLLGLLHPTKGRALMLGGDSTDAAINSRIGFMPEESYLYRYLNARETLDFYGNLFGLPSKVRTMRTEALLDMVGLKAVANRPVGTFSKGMARRIGLAQALINDPDLLILDEPTTGLDPLGTRQIKDLIIQLAKRGKTILLCSHLLADVEDVCDRIAILYGGKIQSQGRVRELLAQTNKMQINVGAISDTAVEKIRHIVESENCEFEVTSPMERLESFFVRTVAEAQAQKQRTSGAVSTTQIGDFLTQGTDGKSISEAILDKLVSADVADKGKTKEPVVTEKVTEAAPAEKPDEHLLSNLTSRSAAVETTTIEKVPVKPEAIEMDKPDVDILEQLVERPHRKDGDNPAGDSGDA